MRRGRGNASAARAAAMRYHECMVDNRFRPLAVMLFALCVAPAAQAVETATPLQGLTFARERCSSCHGVEHGDEFSPNPLAPTFAAIAKTPGMTATALSVALRSSHQMMPDFMLSSEEIAMINAYLATLKGGE
jgi:mono/diheme cytochrome c family protein